MSDALKKNSKELIARLVSKRKALSTEPTISSDASELIRHTAESIFTTRHFVKQSLGADGGDQAVAPASASETELTPQQQRDKHRPAVEATEPGQIVEILRGQLVKILKKCMAEGAEGGSGRWLGQTMSDEALALVVCAAAVLLDDDALSLASVPPRVAAETFADFWADVRAPGIHLPAWTLKVHELLKIAGVAVEPLPDQAMPPQPSAEALVDRRNRKRSPSASPAAVPAAQEAPAVQPQRQQPPAPQHQQQHFQQVQQPVHQQQLQQLPPAYAPQQMMSPPPQGFAPPRPVAAGPFANPVASVSALDASGALGFRITADEFGFAAHTIDAMAIHLGATDRRHLAFTLYRLCTGADVNAAAARFGLDPSAPVSFPLKALFNPDVQARLEDSIPVSCPEQVVEQRYPDLGRAWNVARRLIATVPVLGNAFYVALQLRLDGLVLTTSRAPRDREHDSCHNLRDIIGAPPAIPNDSHTQPHYVGPVALKGAQLMLTPAVDQSEQSQAQSEIISRILQPAAECRVFFDRFGLLMAPRGVERTACVGMVNLICLGWNIERGTFLHQQQAPMAPAPPAQEPPHQQSGGGKRGGGGGGAGSGSAGGAGAGDFSKWPPHLLAQANAATVQQQIEAVRKSNRCAFCGNVHQGSTQRRNHCLMFEHHPLYDSSRHFAVAYLVTKGQLEPSKVRK